MTETNMPQGENPSIEPQLPVLTKEEWHRQVPEAVSQANQSGEPVTAIILDLDSFKAVNDTEGHLEGDRVIDEVKGFLGALAHTLRTEDATQDQEHRSSKEADQHDLLSAPTPIINPSPSRIKDAQAAHQGGDEYAILAHTDEAGAKVILKRIEDVFETYINDPRNAKLKELGLNISSGTATLKPNETASDLLRRADKDLYANKIANLPELTDEQKEHLHAILDHAEAAGMRLRDLPKFAARLVMEQTVALELVPQTESRRKVGLARRIAGRLGRKLVDFSGTGNGR